MKAPALRPAWRRSVHHLLNVINYPVTPSARVLREHVGRMLDAKVVADSFPNRPATAGVFSEYAKQRPLILRCPTADRGSQPTAAFGVGPLAPPSTAVDRALQWLAETPHVTFEIFCCPTCFRFQRREHGRQKFCDATCEDRSRTRDRAAYMRAWRKNPMVKRRNPVKRNRTRSK